MAAGKEVVFDLDAAAFASDEFRMYQFKVKRCPRARPHDWTQCPFAHPGEKAKRRDPRRYRYSGTACPEFRRSCTDGLNCKRRVCFFAHTDAELRKPEEDPVWLQQQLQAELAAEQQVQQQANAIKMIAALVNQSSPTATVESNAELLKTIPQLASLSALLNSAGQSTTAPAASIPTQPSLAPAPASGGFEDQLRNLLTTAQQGQPNQSSPTLLQLISLLERVQASGSNASSSAAAPASAAATSSASSSNSSQQDQAKIAQQMPSQPDNLQVRLGRLGLTEPAKQVQALEMLSLLTNGSGNNATLMAALQQLSLNTAATSSSGEQTPSTPSPVPESSVPVPITPTISLDGPAPAEDAAASDSNAAIAAILDNQAKALNSGGPVNIAALEGLLTQLKAAEAAKRSGPSDPAHQREAPLDATPVAAPAAGAGGGTASAANTAAAIALLTGNVPPPAAVPQPPQEEAARASAKDAGAAALAAAISALTGGTAAGAQPGGQQAAAAAGHKSISAAELLSTLAHEDVMDKARALLDSITKLKADAPGPSHQPSADC